MIGEISVGAVGIIGAVFTAYWKKQLDREHEHELSTREKKEREYEKVLDELTILCHKLYKENGEINDADLVGIRELIRPLISWASTPVLSACLRLEGHAKKFTSDRIKKDDIEKMFRLLGEVILEVRKDLGHKGRLNEIALGATYMSIVAKKQEPIFDRSIQVKIKADHGKA